jgi:hypothetical protein
MEKEEFNGNDELGRLIRQSPLDCPADGFVDRVMAAIQTENVVVPEKISFIGYVNLMMPYAALALFCMVFFFYSDLPFLNRILGRGFLTNEITPYFGILVDSLKSTFSSKYITYGFLIGLAGGFLFLVDRFFSRRSTV